MKNLLVTFCFSLLLTGGIFAQDVSEVPATKIANGEENADGPSMYFETNVVDFGEIVQDGDPFRKVVFTNTGNAPLVIKNAKGSCGCTVPIWSKEPIMPGQTDTLTVRYDTKRVGPIRKSVTLYTNQNEEPYTLQVIGKVNPKPKEPEALPEKSPNILGKQGQ